jgi:hypothetical protein
VVPGAGPLLASGATHLQGYTVDAAGAPVPDDGTAAGASDDRDSTLQQDLYATGNAQGPRQPRIEGSLKPGQQPDIYVDEQGNVIPGQGGASTFERPEQLVTKGYVWKLPMCAVLSGPTMGTCLWIEWKTAKTRVIASR